MADRIWNHTLLAIARAVLTADLGPVDRNRPSVLLTIPGNYDKAYEAFRRAYAVEKNIEPILRELSGACLELRRFDEAVEIAQAAVSLDPTNAELLGNLAVAFLLAGQFVPARKTIDAATKIDPSDRINQTISSVLREIETGLRVQPQSLRDLTRPAQPKRWSLFKRFWQ